MIARETNEVLNRLLALHCHSLPMYLSFSMPSLLRGDDRASQTFAAIVADQKRVVETIGEAIVEGEGRVSMGEFPMSFTSLHDLSFDFLLRKMIEHQQRMVREISRCVQELQTAPRYAALASEALGLAKGHLESLTELKVPFLSAA